MAQAETNTTTSRRALLAAGASHGGFCRGTRHLHYTVNPSFDCI